MCPAHSMENLIVEGAGFAGGAVWGLGQDAHSHDMMARIDLDSYSPMSWQPGTARFASDLYVDDQPHPYCTRVNLTRILRRAHDAAYTCNIGIEPEHFLVVKDPDGSIRPWDPLGVDQVAKPCYDFKS